MHCDLCLHLLFICFSLPIIYGQTAPSCFISRQASNHGFHRELETAILLKSSTDIQLKSCKVSLAENVTSSFYFDKDQIEMLYNMGVPQVYSEQNIDVEKPALQSLPHVVYVYQDLTPLTSENGGARFAANFSLPFHLRYHQPSNDETHYFTAELQPPKVFIQCPDIPCRSSPAKQCKSTPIHCISNEDAVLRFNIPIGSLGHSKSVLFVTFLTVFCGSVHLFMISSSKNNQYNGIT